MIYATPQLPEEDEAVLMLIHEQRETLRYSVAQAPNRWSGFLRRNTFARALQGSNSIEGINASLSDAVAIVDDEKPDTVEEKTYQALAGYRNALTYILQTHDDPTFELNAQVVKSLHFMMLSYDLTKAPGQFRSGSIFIVNEPSGQTVYEGPDASRVPELVNALMASLVQDVDVDPMIRGAMAHLNLTMIHPFKDGNGRMARALQTLVMTRNGVLSPMFCSIEEWLGRNTESYYQILAEVGQGRWNPSRDASPWVKFCLRAHYQQAATLVQRDKAMARVFDEITKLSVIHKVHDRMEMSLVDAAMGFKIRAGRYQEENQVSDVVASRDLRRLCELGLLEPVGEKRGRYYIGAKPLKEIYARSRLGRVPVGDPYDIVRKAPSKSQPMLPGVG
jgi:Fic family protein